LKSPVELTGSRRSTAWVFCWRGCVGPEVASAEAAPGNTAIPTARAMMALRAVLGCPMRGGSDRGLSSASDYAWRRPTYENVDVRLNLPGRTVDAGARGAAVGAATATVLAASPSGSPGRPRRR
jgi:hypothetical protein